MFVLRVMLLKGVFLLPAPDMFGYRAISGGITVTMCGLPAGGNVLPEHMRDGSASVG